MRARERHEVVAHRPPAAAGRRRRGPAAANAALCIAGDTECAIGDPTRPYTSVDGADRSKAVVVEQRVGAHLTDVADAARVGPRRSEAARPGRASRARPRPSRSGPPAAARRRPTCRRPSSGRQSLKRFAFAGNLDRPPRRSRASRARDRQGRPASRRNRATRGRSGGRWCARGDRRSRRAIRCRRTRRPGRAPRPSNRRRSSSDPLKLPPSHAARQVTMTGPPPPGQRAGHIGIADGVEPQLDQVGLARAGRALRAAPPSWAPSRSHRAAVGSSRLVHGSTDTSKKKPLQPVG